MDFTLMDAFSRLQHVSSGQTTYWGFFSTATLALIAFLGANWGKPQYQKLYSFLFFGFLVFAASNCFEILALQNSINACLLSISDYSKSHAESIDQSFKPIFEAIKPFPVSAVATFHIIIDICVLALIMASGRSARKAVSEQQTGSGKDS